MANQLTVLIPCKDERMNIRPCIESLHDLADEILIADSGSTDGTLDIVHQIGGCRIIEREYIHSGDFKNWAIPQARCPWVLIVDADERVGMRLSEEIRRVLQTDPRCDGYWLYRENYFLGHRIRFSGWQTDKVLRLFRRDAGRYVGNNDHAEVAIRSGRGGATQVAAPPLHLLELRSVFQEVPPLHDLSGPTLVPPGATSRCPTNDLHRAAAVLAHLLHSARLPRRPGRIPSLRPDGLGILYETGPPLGTLPRPATARSRSQPPAPSRD